jgi:hypothetical protein
MILNGELFGVRENQLVEGREEEGVRGGEYYRSIEIYI